MKNYTELKTFEDACQVLGLDPKSTIPNFDGYPEKDREAMIAHAKLVIIIRAANQLENNNKEWVPNWNDSSERKYEPWFDMRDNRDGSSGFRFDVYVDWRAYSNVGSRLCFKSSVVCEHVATQFLELYRAYLL